ncbi:MAG: hypothetical protein WB791_10705 [Waddliaceae bacterium]
MDDNQKIKFLVEKTKEGVFTRAVEESTDILVDQELVKGKGLRTEEELRKSCYQTVKRELHQKLEEIQKQFEEGFQIITTEIPTVLTGNDLRDYEAEMTAARENLLQTEEGALSGRMKSKGVPADFLGLTEKTMGAVYRIGYRHYEDKDFENASKVFFFLTALNPLVFDYWLAYGLASHQMKCYERALKCFANAVFLDPAQPLPRWYAAEAYLANGEVEDAFLEWQELEKLIKEHSLGEHWKEIENYLKEKIHYLKQQP